MATGIKVHVAGNVFEGTVFAIDPVTKSIVLKNEESYRLINSAHITKIEGDLSTTVLPNLAEFGTNISLLEKKERHALENAETSIKSINSKVGPEIQALYDRLSFIFPCIWEPNTNAIILCETYKIDSPYDSVVPLKGAPEDKAGLERVVKVLDGERKKLKL